jgi:hypothetical protein
MLADLLKKVKSVLPGGSAEPSEDPLQAAAADWVPKAWDTVKEAFVMYHQAAWGCFLMYSGKMWIEWDKQRKTYVPKEPADEYVPTPDINRFSPACDAVASNFARVPEIEAVPTKITDENSHEIASVVSKLCDHAIKDNALRSDYKNDEDKAGLAAQLLTLCGSAFTEVWVQTLTVGEQPRMEQRPAFGVQCLTCDTYNVSPQPPPPVCPTCQQPYQVTQTQAQLPVLDETSGEPIMDPIHKYKVNVKVGNPIYAYPRPGSTNMGGIYFGWAERLPLSEIKSRWEIEAEPDQLYPDGFTTQFENTLNYFYQGFMSGTNKMEDSALVVRFFVEKPGPNRPGVIDFPEGLEAILINGEVKKAVPWDFVEHPFTKADYTQIPTLFFGRSVAFDLFNIQQEINRYESLIALHGMVTAVDPIVVEENSVVSEITGRSDKQIIWRSSGPGSSPPHRMGHGSLDPAVYQKLEALHSEMENISGAVSVFRGQQEGDITAASAISQLRGQAEMMFSKPVNNWNNLWKETVRKIIKNYQRYLTPAEIAAIVGPNLEVAINAFKMCDLDAMVELVATDHGLPRTRDERRQEMMALFDAHALDLNDANVRQKIFELFGETGMMKTFNADATRARMENKRMQSGQPPMFLPSIQDNAVHFSIHAEAINSLGFDKLPPPVQQLMIEHANATKAVLQPPALPPAGGQPAPNKPQGGPNHAPTAPVPPPVAPGTPHPTAV